MDKVQNEIGTSKWLRHPLVLPLYVIHYPQPDYEEQMKCNRPPTGGNPTAEHTIC